MESTDQVVQTSPLLQSLRILAVDDEKDSLLMLQVMLESEGATVTTATSVHAALEAFSFCPADLIISDIAMPDGNGLTFIQKIRLFSEARGGTIPAIAFSALDPDLCAPKCLKAGFQAYVAKPIDPETLFQAILDVVNLPMTQQKSPFTLTVNCQSHLA